jgi:ribonuclease P protein component
VRPQGFPPALRIRSGRDFDRAFREGASAGDDRLVVHARPNGGPHPRLGLAVGKGVGGAVVRNRVKRLLREAFRRSRGSLPPAHDLVVVAKPGGSGPWTLEEAERSLLGLAAKAAERLARGGERRGRRGPGG